MVHAPPGAEWQNGISTLELGRLCRARLGRLAWRAHSLSISPRTMASELKRPSSPSGNDEPSPKRQAKGDATNPAGGDEKQSIPAPGAAPDHSVSVSIASDSAAGTTNATSSSSDADATILDVCTLRPGDRIEVKWDLHVDVPIETAAVTAAGGSNGDADANASHQNQMQTPAKQIRMRTTTVTKWWGAVLLPPDGRTHVLTDDGGDFGSSPPPVTPKKPADAATVPVRTLDYDAFPTHGFPDRSVEDVVILSDHTLLNMSSGSRAHYRAEGTGWEPSDSEQIGVDGLCGADLGGEVADGTATVPVATPSSSDAAATAAASSTSPFVTVDGEEGIRTVLDSVLMKAMTGVSDQLGRLNAAQQRVVAAKIADAKEKLVAKMVEARDGSGGGSANDGAGRTVITPEYVKQCMEEVGKEL